MCGIVGTINAGSRRVDGRILEKMNQAIRHRGPDEDGFYIKENVGLAMRRLSIIDLAHGKQPIFSSDKSKVIVYNGEIYNFRELRNDLEKNGHVFQTKSDTEVILRLYEKYGSDCVLHLRGMFAFAIWDESDRSLFIARDRVGKKPLLYSHRPDGSLIFGSEFRALLQHPDISKEIDHEAIDNYLSYSCIPAPQTAYKQIRKLKPAHWLRWKNGEVQTEKYWSPDFSEKLRISESEAEAKTLEILREAVKLRLISEVPLGAFLSGGVDSSLVVALMAEASEKPVKTFSIGFEEQDYSELKYARRVAKHIGAEHNEFIVKPDALKVLPKLVEHYGEPYADSSAIPTFYVSRETRKHVTVALNGDGGDESFAGYERYAAMRLAEKYQRFPTLLRKSLVEMPLSIVPAPNNFRNRIQRAKRFVRSASLPKAERYFQWMCAFDRESKQEIYTSDFKQELNGQRSLDILDRWFSASDDLGIVDAAMTTDIMTYLPNDLLVKVDIASMANSLEARSPLLDHKVIEFAASLPENIKFRTTEPKYLLKKIAAKLVPREVIYRRKMGFGVPIANWLKGEMQTFLRENLLSKKHENRGLFRPEITKMLVEKHINDEKDYSKQLWTLLMLEMWFQRFIDE